MLQPLGDKVLVRPISGQEVTKSGIVLPDTAKEKPQEGEVVALGHGKVIGDKVVSFAEMGLSVGNKVVFGKYSPNEIEVDGEEMFIISADDIYGVIK
ncbi:MAG: 10 kDa chaperonin [Berkelbacteria bacterium GW2011_GWA2_38_9]|uniref:Co-chaperonin GroES n=1 Tax=Berkelbacteria bacterium GW2011_GWA2_38_9 TaxID=1618334 RepID=A0A0G0NW97_9BACT|nr:MAG: 10 kDa chaperonin [Berkelbacteria bacterium GW2011_GWA2_38_9]